jgi:hypothetical protein
MWAGRQKLLLWKSKRQATSCMLQASGNALSKFFLKAYSMKLAAYS